MKYECTKCKKEKTQEEMSKDRSRRNGISSWCKECRKVSSRTWTIKNPARVKERYRLNKDKPVDSLQTRDYSLRSRYNLSLEDYAELLKSQNYLCAICNRDSREMTYFLHVDHCHTTGKVRGLLCAPCNVYLGYTKDNPDIYKNGTRYLLKSKK